MYLDQKILDRLQAIQWFAACGQSSSKTYGFNVTWLNDWQSASEHFNDQEWQNTTLEARNQLTVHLAKKHIAEYQEWNRLTREAKSKLQGIFGIIESFQQQNKLSKNFLDCARWDLLGAVMEATYTSFRPPIFFAKLLAIYEDGHFPCGWKGEWPNGNLIAI